MCITSLPAEYLNMRMLFANNIKYRYVVKKIYYYTKSSACANKYTSCFYDDSFWVPVDTKIWEYPVSR